MSVKWKQMFIAAQSFSLIYLIVRTLLDSLRSIGVLELSTLAGIGVVLQNIAYGLYLWFWFIRLEITFNQTKELAITQKEKNAMKVIFIIALIVSIFVCLVFLFSRTVHNKAGVFTCYPHDDWYLLCQLLGLIAILIYLIFAIYLCVIYIVKLKTVLLLGEMHDNSRGIDDCQRLAVRKTAVIAVTSLLCSALLLLAYVASNGDPMYAAIDLLLNSLFITCYFQFAKPLYDVVFCLCERYNERLDGLVGINKARVRASQHEKVSSATFGYEIDQVVTSSVEID